ncbi:N-acetyl-gamma-glutamyl-phosphate reductase [Leifsonia xyli subsp. xyli]|uniref:N-acetyl-gamma-glutamyl-phosphate reductase n=2 Tax=Leifsonia xyli subsp. xyli TaxID=59736 RepID=ARGC_LEIXX|nr:N-acetyl-gamma-glutamyl-phosphate reductase [Leifsonia xyli]Q6AGD3.1 RecName: Full=N-acetyl-gamma-glutamyl-phosphate reductase; Short=AGPR; AltName: Full=N-acetyl-glutamate semialdehyde dehydrogenase; Short=NAGSA dehydrogenase [Leifsonia xyli subsp. xyli str. CTCB07]AAT88562.1 N-acetyl-gamma-glutamyl-phosphate reductase [Leifsonia xyli subsp. xyli str. CTCB07]ODA90141.1 N-acetyl-gamma-glutamyl-phosphate reductase [Leifsonia xyli subsp. xyli]
MTFSVAVAGASGYAGGELLRILADHPDFDIRTVTAHQNAGQPLAAHQPHLRSLAGLTLSESTAENLAGHDVVFLALPHGKSGEIATQLPADTLVVDCGADHRLEDPDAWAAFYGGEHFGSWAYGVPELPVGAGRQRERLAGAKRIAAPGCNASAVSLALAPGIHAGLIEDADIVSVLAVGPSGAGKALKTMYLASEILGSANPYAVGGTHRHIPEIQQSLRKAGALSPTISFIPVLVPMSRGILATSTARVKPGVSAAQVQAAWEETYAGEPFVQVLPAGSVPRTSDVLGANTALIGVALDAAAGRVVAVLAIDNLYKGTAGAAIQSANIALGLAETAGLSVNGVAP